MQMCVEAEIRVVKLSDNLNYEWVWVTGDEGVKIKSYISLSIYYFGSNNPSLN